MKRLQDLSLRKRKAIVWTVAGIAAVLLFFIQFFIIRERGERPEFDFLPVNISEGLEGIGEEIGEMFEEREKDFRGGIDEKEEEEIKKLLEEEIKSNEENE